MHRSILLQDQKGIEILNYQLFLTLILFGHLGYFRPNQGTQCNLFDAVSPLSMFSIIQPLFYQKLSHYSHIPKIQLELEFGPQRIRDLAFNVRSL